MIIIFVRSIEVRSYWITGVNIHWIVHSFLGWVCAAVCIFKFISYGQQETVYSLPIFVIGCKMQRFAELIYQPMVEFFNRNEEGKDMGSRSCVDIPF